jgi:hypothetical protein
MHGELQKTFKTTLHAFGFPLGQLNHKPVSLSHSGHPNLRFGVNSLVANNFNQMCSMVAK